MNIAAEEGGNKWEKAGPIALFLVANEIEKEDLPAMTDALPKTYESNTKAGPKKEDDPKSKGGPKKKAGPK